jgi:WD40 repeat protein
MRWSHGVQGAGSVAASAAGQTLATVIGYEVQLRDSASGDVTRAWATDEPLSPLAFSPDGKILAAGITEWGPYGGRGGEMSGGVQFWNVEQGSLLRTISDDEPTTFLRYSPDGQSLATASNDGPVKLWNASTGELIRIFPGRRADFSPDGQTIACVSIERDVNKTIGTFDLYNVADGARVRTLSSEPGPAASWLLCVSFSPDGRRLAATDWNGTVTLWDVATGRRERTIADHQAGVLTAAFSPDGSTLATGGEDRTLRLWKLAGDPPQPTRAESAARR